jgi:bacteriocin biosynthesis cyclodehydratase domain-containing protein
VLALLDGSRDRDAVIAAAQEYGVPAAAAGRVLAVLASAGVLDDFPGRLHGSLPPQLRARLAPEMATAALAYAHGDGGARTLARRRGAYVRVHGAGRTGACVASFLAASGIGHVSCTDPSPASPADLAPAGLVLADLGSAREEGAARAVSRCAPEVSTVDDGAVPDLVILTGLTLPGLTSQLIRDRVPHLALRTGEAIGVVGPLVRPGRSACLHCVDLRKADADPLWPKILAQATFARLGPPACDTVLAAMTATLAAAQALAFVDRPDRVPVTSDGTLELVLPDWQWRRRTWRPHPSCWCGASDVSGFHDAGGGTGASGAGTADGASDAGGAGGTSGDAGSGARESRLPVRRIVRQFRALSIFRDDNGTHGPVKSGKPDIARCPAMIVGHCTPHQGCFGPRSRSCPR